MKYKVRTPEQALAYIADCTLATVQDLAMKKSRPKGEYARQILIAQLAVDWMTDFEIDVSKTRARDINGETVADWAKRYEV